MDQLVEKAKNIIRKNIYMTLATASLSGEPWVSPVYYAYDAEFNFYWYSGNNTKHSQLISLNNKVSVVIFNSSANENEAGGLYFEGHASEVKESELAIALKVYSRRAFSNDEVSRAQFVGAPQDFFGDSVLRMYKCTPSHIYISGDAKKWNNKWIDERIEITLR